MSNVNPGCPVTKSLLILKYALHSFIKNGCFNMAAATAFFAILSTIPLIFVVVSTVGFFFEGAEQILETASVATDAAFPSLSEVIQREVSAVVRRKGLIGGVGLIIMFWSSTLIFSSIEFSFNRIFNIEERRSFIRSKIISMGLVISGVIALSASVLLTTVAKIAKSTFHFVDGTVVADFFSSSIFVQYLLPVLILTFIFTVMYSVLSRQHLNVKEAFAGGFICALLFEGAKYIFSWYIANLSSHSIIYGSLGAIVVVILWFFYAAIIMLFCAELMASFKRFKNSSLT